MLDDLEFFARVHPLVRADLDVFAAAIRRLALNPLDLEARETVITKATSLLNEASVVCGIEASNSRQAGMGGFCSSLRAYMERIHPPGQKALAQGAADLDAHLRYYEEHVPAAADDEQAQSDDLQFAYFKDFSANVVAVLCNTVFGRYKWQSPDPRKATVFFDTTRHAGAASDRARDVMDMAAAVLQGWCSPQKAMMLYTLAREFKPQNAVEIGIFGGRSIVPIAAALVDNGSGSVTGIETWSAAASTKFQTNIANDFSWSLTDYATIKRDFMKFVLQSDLYRVIKIVEASSDLAHYVVDNIDFIHIDGGHSIFGAAQDVSNFVPKVKSGSIVVFDDIEWSTTGPGLEMLMDTCRLLHVVPSMGSTTVPGCAAFIKL